ncbi:MAG TPA: SDR family NAD(P)-dependent oxidoreductase, partial [Gemmatimonas sp.]|nr:SDR family NAD(P)-dependent oxidoreductase [Gemmatimonas sp.]
MPRKSPEHVIVVTGASNGPGRAVALEFALHGDALVLGSRREGPLESIRRDCETLHALVESRVTDLSDADEAYALANAALARFKRIDIWINYAPAVPLLRGDATPISAFTDASALDFTGYQHGANAALASFKALGGGVLINVDCLIGGAPPGLEERFDEARQRMRETFEEIEARANEIPGVTVMNVSPPKTPIAAETLAPMVVSLALTGAMPGIVGRVRSAIERERFKLWIRAVPAHRKSARPELLLPRGTVEERSPWDRTDTAEEDRQVSARARSYSRARARAASREDLPGRQGTWRLAASQPARESAGTMVL